MQDFEDILEMFEDYKRDPRPMDQEPRNMYVDERSGFMEGKLVKQGPNTGKWVVRDLYSRGDKRGSTIYFNSETEASKAIADRKTETGKQQTNAELTKKYKSLLKEEGYKSWADAPKDVKKLLKNRMSSPIKVGPSKIKEKTIKLLEEKKPINPKTGLPYTQKEYIKLTTGQKSSLSAKLRGKKQKGQYQKRQGYYPEKEGNRLINYMRKAAEQQGKLPIKDRTYTNVFVDDKFVGVNDIKNNKLYTHIDYDLSKDGAKKGTVITKHPGYEGLDNFFKAAKKFKYESPDKLLGSYFSKYERVPTYNEMYNFFTVDRDAPVKAFTSNNGLTIHHQDVIAKNPTSNFQLLTTKKNTEANTIMNRLKRGEITEARANYDLNKIGAGQEGYGVPKEKITPGKGLGVAKREAVKLFKDAYKVNPNVVEDITQKLGILGCPKGLQAAAGGRIKFNKGTSCAIKGKNKLEQILLKGGGNKTENTLAEGILKTGKGLKNMASLKNLFGPAALAFGAATEAGIVGYDMLASGKTFKEALGDSLLNYGLGDKTKIDPRKERDKRFRDVGTTEKEMGKIAAFENAIKEIEGLEQIYSAPEKAQTELDKAKKFYNPKIIEQRQKVYDNSRADIQDLNRTGTPDRLMNVDYDAGAKALKQAEDKSSIQKLESRGPQIFGSVFPKAEESRQQKLRDLKSYVNPAHNIFSAEDREAMGGYTYGFNEGGLAGLMKKYYD